MIFLTTIWHTGTHHVRKSLPSDVEWLHCGDKALGKLAEPGVYCEVVTTYRDPLRVGASWSNRGNFESVNNISTWHEQWPAWSKILEIKHTPVRMFRLDARGPENSYDDDRGLHAALDRGDLDYYYSVVPQEYIDFAMRYAEPHQ